MKSLIILLICLLAISCKTNSKLIGEYQTNSPDSLLYSFNINTKKYTEKRSTSSTKGNFKILILSPEKALLICNDKILKKNDDFTQEKNNTSDSTYVFSFDGFENLGSTGFEITSKGENLKYRKTYTNDLLKTASEGILIKKATDIH